MSTLGGALQGKSTVALKPRDSVFPFLRASDTCPAVQLHESNAVRNALFARGGPINMKPCRQSHMIIARGTPPRFLYGSVPQGGRDAFVLTTDTWLPRQQHTNDATHHHSQRQDFGDREMETLRSPETPLGTRVGVCMGAVQ
jgi:hypothetical protein